MTLWTVALQALLSTEFSRQEYWSELPLPTSGDLPNSVIKPGSPALQAVSLQSEPAGKSDYTLPPVKLEMEVSREVVRSRHRWILKVPRGFWGAIKLENHCFLQSPEPALSENFLEMENLRPSTGLVNQHLRPLPVTCVTCFREQLREVK